MSAFFETTTDPIQYLTGHLNEGEEIERNGSKYGMKYHSLAFNKPERKLNPFVIEYTPNKEQRNFDLHFVCIVTRTRDRRDWFSVLL